MMLHDKLDALRIDRIEQTLEAQQTLLGRLLAVAGADHVAPQSDDSSRAWRQAYRKCQEPES